MAIELFEKSTMKAAKMGAIELEGGTGDAERTCENLIRQRIHIGQSIPKKRLVDEILAQRMEGGAVLRAINALVKRSELEEQNQGKRLKRVR